MHPYSVIHTSRAAAAGGYQLLAQLQAVRNLRFGFSIAVLLKTQVTSTLACNDELAAIHQCLVELFDFHHIACDVVVTDRQTAPDLTSNGLHTPQRLAGATCTMRWRLQMSCRNWESQGPHCNSC